MKYFAICIFESECRYESLNSLAYQEGKSVGSAGNAGGDWVDVKHCQKTCDATPGCNSIGVCQNDQCYLYDRIQNKNTKTKKRAGQEKCFTTFRTCPSIRMFDFENNSCYLSNFLLDNYISCFLRIHFMFLFSTL